ncbi:GntR family transcriptional regulator [Phyllobacterium sp. 21LDTY02-6]|jgi:DNA-binding GntR family transcriptional regulator|uniref:GntR family transcriptional regulator n=1 Tax=unclassified Phyllobacterium TaxID=2638441 RepID=UPI0020217BF0|nr:MULTISPECIES: GntR family transcriptional regulator [unclassified Phyllobacterium]MCO4318499.1 GntR family transcriptional regulator [Phyllobacterium sp. 21LDTY02-6]MCX8281416.1 GntR family transcriptional regulator [Phyllobacterium sp. 0TCS1.6C]MCX8295928.1 GntR family transcriptional regulator [Phyllobacterium sp. 0TCS1.6A]
MASEVVEPAGRRAVATISRQSLHGEIVTRLRDMIIEGDLQPGERIYENQLGEELGVSRTPLREALKFLASEGLVELVPSRGAVVKRFSPKDIEDMLIVIRSMEMLAGRIACAIASDEGIAGLRLLHDAMVRHYEAGERLEYYKLNQQIHTGIVALADNAPLAEVHGLLQSRVKRIRFIGHEGPERWANAVAEHERIMAALERRDAETLARELDVHLANGWERVKSVL